MRRIVLALLAIVATAAPALADKVYCHDGRVIEGKIIAEDRTTVQVEKRLGSITSVITLTREEILRIEKVASPEEEFEAAFAKAKSAADFVKAGKRAKADGLEAAAERAFKRALELDRENKDAHEGLGHRFHEGRWWTPAEWAERPEEKERAKEAAAEAARRRAAGHEEKYGKELEGVPWGDAHIITTRHYVVKCNSTKEVAQRYADFLEKIYAAYDKVFSKYKRYWDKPSVVYIFRNVQEFREYMGVDEGVGGFYIPESENENAYPNRIIAAFHGRFGSTGDTRLVLAHEGTHQMEHILCAGSEAQFRWRPTWWMEGLAVYFGDGYSLDKRGNLKIGIPRDRLVMLRKLMKAGIVPDKVKLSDFVKWDLRAYQGYAGIAYPYGWGLCHYFLHRGEDRKGKQTPVKIKGKEIDLRKAFEDYFKFITDAPPESWKPHEAAELYAKKLDEILGMPIDDLTEDWKKYIDSLEVPKLGKVKGAVFESTDASFTIEKPKDWKWNEDEATGDEAIVLESADGAARIAVSVDGNMDNASFDEAVSELEDAIRGRFELDMEKSREVELHGFKAHEFVYRGTLEEGGAETADGKPPQGPQAFRHVIVPTLKRIYGIECRCPEGEIEAYAATFEKVLQGFKILRDKEN